MASELKLPPDPEEHEQEACQIAAVPSTVSGDLHQLKGFQSFEKGELESNGARSATTGKSYRTSHSTYPQSTSAAQCATDKPIVAPTTAFSNYDDCNHANWPNNEKRKRSIDSDLSHLMSQCLSESSQTHVSNKKPQHSKHIALELEKLEKQTLLRYKTPTHEDSATNRAVSLLYNECSLVAISNWVSGATLPLSGLLVDSGFRRCHTCKKWGHYESECLLGEGATATRTEHMAYFGNLSDRESKYIVETCNGFVFEQRAVHSRPKGNHEPLPEGYLAVSTVEIDGSLITSVKALEK